MRSKDKIDVLAAIMPLYGGKRWIKVRPKRPDGEFVPSFEDLYRILVGIVACEKEKYPNLPHDPAILVADLCVYACFGPEAMYDLSLPSGERAKAIEDYWQLIRAKFKIPQR